ncbi:STAS domain-containing protein [Paenibacillus hexagrammi]|uniref:Anti-sigma factor antagonist n=1 Tax=Paenibacillus hexagrammi TaxID=2908839 RepID=A0ABY3SJH6_9BACL|nr:STAS domain-containing protein [Paenibacillus sp. YPD9-1]UJF34106.1 STAS domain-containing protein [Paenibacillus sp. YPD9-1]
MEISEQLHGDAVLLMINGRLDANYASDLESYFMQLVEKGHRRFVFDLHGLHYVSSAGLRSLLVAAKMIKVIQGKLALARMTEGVKDVFDMSGFSAIFSVYESEADALYAVQ